MDNVSEYVFVIIVDIKDNKYLAEATIMQVMR